MSATLAVSGLLSVAIAGVYVFVGSRLARRPVSAEAQPPLQLFATWWFSLAGFELATGSGRLLAVGNVTMVGLHAGLEYVSLFFITLGVFSLVFYLVYLRRGRLRWLSLGSFVYAMFFVWLLYRLTMGEPETLGISTWTTEIRYADPLGDLFGIAIVLFLLVPPLLASMAYLSLYRHVDTSTQRYRIAVVGASLVLWMGSGLVGYLALEPQFTLWPVVSILIGLGGALALFLAYFPPRWVQDRGVEPLSAQTRLTARVEEE